MPLLDTKPDLTLYREIALVQAQREHRTYLVIPHGDPREQWPWKSPYVTPEETATTWERANAVARMTP